MKTSKWLMAAAVSAAPSRSSDRAPDRGPARAFERRLGIVRDDVAPLVGAERLLRAQLVLEHREVRLRGVVALARARAATRARSVASLAVEGDDHERNRRAPPRARGTGRAASARGTSPSTIATQPAAAIASRERAQARVGRARSRRARTGRRRSPTPLRRRASDAVQALALDVGADAHRADLLQQRLRQRRLAAAGEAVRDDDRRTRRLARSAAASSQVAAVFRERRAAFASPAGELRRAQARDLGAHHRAIDEVEAQHARARRSRR